ncbi:MAG: hypothetical protein MK289_03990 [Trichodesmium sp. ALOHA_ZT_67]|nr:hypothetical protein [Trichodesmium sp. ALOHA_ZT_67]
MEANLQTSKPTNKQKNNKLISNLLPTVPFRSVPFRENIEKAQKKIAKARKKVADMRQHRYLKTTAPL